LDSSKPMSLHEFLYILVTLGAGSSDRPRRILLPDATYEEAFHQGFSLEELWELGYEDLHKFRRAEWSAHSVVKAGYGEAWQLRQVGYTVSELRKIGLPAKHLKLAGYSFEEMRNAGFSSASLRDCVTTLSKHRVQRSNSDSALTLRLPEHLPRPSSAAAATTSVFDAGGPNGEKRWWATPRIRSMLDGPPGRKGTPGPKRSNVRIRPITR